MRGDRQSAYESYDQPNIAAALRNEFEIGNVISEFHQRQRTNKSSKHNEGKNALKQGESLEGAVKFISGVGKHGKFDSKL